MYISAVVQIRKSHHSRSVQYIGFDDSILAAHYLHVCSFRQKLGDFAASLILESLNLNGH